ncbi:acid phosphatase-like protein [Zalerion maritima]|uniref:Phytase A n=1 Tax=Zalerion maritima TaxID=339359 RepID=A0AAD5WPL2_9PEZI|nr:acid phosphatase-like protein [Zalerion maritima]
MGVSNIIESVKGFLAQGLGGSYKYSVLPEHRISSREPRSQSLQKSQEEKFRRTLKLAMTGLIAFAIFFVLVVSSTGNALNNKTSCDTIYQGYQCATEISRHWGQYSPYFSVPSEISNEIPEGCTVTFAQVVSRHGARDPTDSKSGAYAAMIAKIQGNATSYGSGFGFLEDFEYTLGKDELTKFGERELYNSGIKFYDRYRSLAASITPFFRASGQNRVIQSAKNFTRGFHATRVSDESAKADLFPYDIVIISEDEGMNNTLDHGLCTNFEEGAIDEIGDNSKGEWADTFVPDIQARVNENLPGANLTADETIYLMDMCPFTTVAKTDGTPTEFCSLFTAEDWANYGYYYTLDKWYGYGPGNPLGPTQGVGFVNELLARLTGDPVTDHTSTNQTLDADPVTFPLGSKLYADFSHDNDMTAMFSAMGLFTGTEDLDKTNRVGTNETSGYSSAATVPFSARLYVEKLQCGSDADEMVRVLLNDRVMPLDGCGSDELGRCKLSEFVESMKFAMTGGLWDSCFT